MTLAALQAPCRCAPDAPTVAFDFDLPPGRIALEPAEVRGEGRDDVRLMVAHRDRLAIEHKKFSAIVDVLAPGDVLVLNVSATLPAALDVRRDDGTSLRLHLSTRLSADTWSVELREPAGEGSVPWSHGRAGEVLRLPGGAGATLLSDYPPGTHANDGAAPRLWLAALRTPVAVDQYLQRHGQPIRYGHGARAWPISAYQTVYAAKPGSAEMPSAGRAFTASLLTRLMARGIGVAPLVLHCGVSSPEAHEPPYPEWYRVPAHTAAWINTARAGGGRIVAAGTTVVRALETCADERGVVHGGEGWTDVVVGPHRMPRAVDGLLTGWHEPGASHLQLLEAIAGSSVLELAYDQAIGRDYLWHEFGDLLLVLP